MSARRPAVARGACHCSNIDIMQLFHELKQQFPAVPDELVSACISDHCHDRPACRARLQRELEARPRALAYPPALMGAPPRIPAPPGADHCATSACPHHKPPVSRTRLPDAGSSVAVAATPPPPTRPPPLRPTTLELPSASVTRPPNTSASNSNVNLSVKVDCSVAVSPAVRRTSVLQLTPEAPWQRSPAACSPRSCYTSVNLTLRTPTSSPQPPIDICSHNSSLTYTTSSFDRRHGTQSELRITVGPAGLNSVSAVRTRLAPPYPQPVPPTVGVAVAAAAAAATATTNTTTGASDTKQHLVLVSRQLERKGLLQTELLASKGRLQALSKEVATLRLENTPDLRDKLRREIRHLRSQCERLTREVDRHPDPTEESAAPRAQAGEEARWPCGICTFRNHPLLTKCEQCEMPRLLLGKPTGPAAVYPPPPPPPPHHVPQLALGMNS